MTTRSIHLWLTAAAVALAAPAQAANLAVLLDAGTEAADGTAAAEARGFLADALAAHGYEVSERSEADRDAMREALEALLDRLDEAERLVMVFAGAVFAEGGALRLLPAGHDGTGAVDAAFDGVPLDLLLELAAERPGRSAVVVAYDAAAGPGEAAAEAPAEDEEADAAAAAARAAEAAQTWARLAVPQGVLVLAGPREAALEAVTGGLLAEGVPAAEAVADLGEEVRVYGFASPDMSFAEPPDEAAAVAPADAATADDATATTAAPDPEAEPGPAAAAEAAEAALGLDQAARRGVQEDLTVLGFSTRGIDGIFGPGTRSAIAEWQAGEGLEATGFLTGDGLARLREQAAAASAALAAEAERARAAEEAADAEFWRTTGAGGTAADLRAYLARYPEGIYAAEARAQLDALEAEARGAAEAEDRAAWDAALAAGDVAAFETYLAERPDGAFRDEAAARIAELAEAPARAAAEAEAAAREEGLGLNLASRALIETQLAAIGHDVGAADGAFDADTRRAIRAFQAAQGLEATGYVDQATVQALIVASLGLR